MMIFEMFNDFLQDLYDLKSRMGRFCKREGHKFGKIDLELNMLGYKVSDGDQLLLLRTLSACFSKVIHEMNMIMSHY